MPDEDGKDGSVPLARKVAFLSRPGTHADGTTAVEVVETHLSFVFLTSSRAYKLKKPVRHPHTDLRSVRARRRNCEEEVRLNRRLAADVYLGIVPLSLDAQDHLRLGGSGLPVDWLVAMRRLPAELMLDRMIRARSVVPAGVEALAARLASFHATAERAGLSPEAYRARLAAEVEANRTALARAGDRLAQETVGECTETARRFLSSRRHVLDARVAADRIVDGHGDLRPEHVFLGPEVAVIDCLEFDRDLRLLDPVDEIGFLALECEMMDAADVARSVIETWGRAAADPPHPLLLAFHQMHRACVRARLAVWHAAEPGRSGPGRWWRRAHDYLALAAARARALQAAGC